jgi:hypothetical protein
MRTRIGLYLVVGCCVALAACTAAAPNGPDATVTPPAVGRPPAPASAEGALSGEAFTPYAALGISSNDGLAPGESEYALIGPCMTAAGYPGVTISDGIVPIGFQLSGQGGLTFTQPWGGWGYLGAADAQQYGFLLSPGAGLLSALGLGSGALPLAGNGPTVSAAEQAAGSKCGAILQDFSRAVQSGPLAGIVTLSNDITADVGNDAAVKAATRAWSACMAKNGYSFSQPANVFIQESQAVYGNAHVITPSTRVSAAANQAQIAVAVTDADCTEASDLDGIYFTVQASYEQQLVTANQQALGAAASQYRAAYTRELSELPTLLRTTKALPFPPAKPATRHGG